MSEVSIDVSNESPPASPVPGPVPLSPNTIASTLAANPNLDAVLLRGICGGLIETTRVREDRHQQQLRLLQAKVNGLQSRIDHHDAQKAVHAQAPEGYEENNGKASNFSIPVGGGLHKLARWVKQMDDGRVAGFTDLDGPNDRPFISEIYAEPHYDEDGAPPAPLPAWFRGILIGASSSYHTFREGVADLDDWGLLADIQRYREADEHIMSLRAKIDSLDRDLKGLQQYRDCCEGRLEGAHAAKRLDHLANLGDRPPRGGGWRASSRNRGPGRYSGRGRPF
jgi:hypothetical protein